MTYITKCPLPLILALDVQKLDGAIHRMNCFPAEKSYGNKVIYPVDRLSIHLLNNCDLNVCSCVKRGLIWKFLILVIISEVFEVRVMFFSRH